jgi:hypothetical protein
MHPTVVRVSGYVKVLLKTSYSYGPAWENKRRNFVRAGGVAVAKVVLRIFT